MKDLSENTNIALGELEREIAKRQYAIVTRVVERIKKVEDPKAEFGELYSLITNEGRSLENLRCLYTPLFEAVYMGDNLDKILHRVESRILP